jgi:hypothetical protein
MIKLKNCLEPSQLIKGIQSSSNFELKLIKREAAWTELRVPTLYIRASLLARPLSNHAHIPCPIEGRRLLKKALGRLGQFSLPDNVEGCKRPTLFFDEKHRSPTRKHRPSTRELSDDAERMKCHSGFDFLSFLVSFWANSSN